MIEKDGAFAASRRKFYEEQYRIAEPIDPWHLYAQEMVHSTTRRWFAEFVTVPSARVLNAGSGGSSYGIQTPMTHLDLFESRIVDQESKLVGDISNIPAEECSFDAVICVGSVLNYADPLRAVRELARVLRPGGVAILEYERSESFEHLVRHGRSNCRRVETFYGGVVTHVWVYGDGFIDGLLAASGMGFRSEHRFHALSSVVLALTGSPRLATRATIGDSFMAQVWPLSSIASNRLLAVEKLADK